MMRRLITAVVGGHGWAPTRATMKRDSTECSSANAFHFGMDWLFRRYSKFSADDSFKVVRTVFSRVPI